MTYNPGKKFIVLMFAVGMSFGLLFASISFVVWQRNNSKTAMLFSATAQAKLISSNVKCSLSFDDGKDANSILDSLKIQNYIAFAGIYDDEGRLFAHYYRDDIKKEDFTPSPPSKARYSVHDGYLVVSEPVIIDHKLIGTVALWAQQ
jgi:uncharacterized membrane protein affecting hemolysin expression